MSRRPVARIARATFAVLFSSALILSPLAASASAVWSPPVKVSIDGNNGAGNGMVLSTAPNGDVVGAWPHLSGGNYAIQTAVSHDNGITWSAPITLSDPNGHAESPQIAINGSGTILVSWNASVPVGWEVQISVSTDSGSTWSSRHTISDSTSSGQSASIVPSGDHGFVAAFNQHNGSFFDILTRSTSDDGFSWTSFHRASDGVTNSFGSTLVMGTAGTLEAAWLVTNSSDCDIVTAASSNGGLTWSSPVTVVSNEVTNCTLQLVPSTSSGFLLFWSRNDGPTASIFSAASSADGTTWNGPVQIDAGVYMYPDITPLSDGSALMLAWVSNDTVTSVINFASSTDDGATWSAPRTITSTPLVNFNNYWNLSIARTSNDRVGLAFNKLSGNMGGEGDIAQAMVSDDGGATWSSPAELGVGDATYPHIAATLNNEFATTWTVVNPAGNEVWAASTSPAVLPNTGTSATAVSAVAAGAMLLAGVGVAVVAWGRLRESNSRPIHYE